MINNTFRDSLTMKLTLESAILWGFRWLTMARKFNAFLKIPKNPPKKQRAPLNISFYIINFLFCFVFREFCEMCVHGYFVCCYPIFGQKETLFRFWNTRKIWLILWKILMKNPPTIQHTAHTMSSKLTDQNFINKH